jgi:hypothetical protein
MTQNSQTQRSPATKLDIAGLVVAAVRLGRRLPDDSPGAIILLAGAAVVAFGPWRWSPVVGLVVALFVSIGGVIATIAGNGFSETVGNPDAVGGFAGALVQIRGLLIAVPAGLVAASRSPASAQPASPAV